MMTPKELHYATVGHFMLHNNMPACLQTLTALGHANLAVIPAETATAALPFGSTQAGPGNTVANVNLGNANGLHPIEQMIGEISGRGGRKQFRLAKPIVTGEIPWPTVDCFGRPYPSVQEILAMGKSKGQRQFTNSGWPKTVVGSSTFYVQDSEGKSYQDKPIAKGDWRMWNGRPGTEARYIKADELATYLVGQGMKQAEVDKLFQEQGCKLPGAAATAAPEGGRKRTARARAAASK